MAILFNSTTGDFIQCGTSSTLTPANLTIQAWIYKTGTPGVGGGGIAGKWFSPGGPKGYMLWLSTGGTISFPCNAGPHLDSGITPSNNVWMHLCGTFDGTTARIYTDGTDRNNQAETITDSGAQFEIGRYDTVANNNFVGRVCEVALWDTALTATDIAILAKAVSPMLVRPDHLVSYWPLFGHGGGAVHPDYFGGFTGNLSGATTADHLLVYRPSGPAIYSSLAATDTGEVRIAQEYRSEYYQHDRVQLAQQYRTEFYRQEKVQIGTEYRTIWYHYPADNLYAAII